MNFKIEEFKHALLRGQHEYFYHTLVQSNAQPNSNYKLPNIVLFLNWNNAAAYRYRSVTMRNVGLNADIDEESEKGIIKLADCNLVHMMLI